MTEIPPAKFRLRYLLAATFGILFCLTLLAGWFLTTAAFWERLGWRFVTAVQDRVNGEVSVARVSGNLVTGMVFSDVKINRSGSEIVRIRELEVSLSILSLFKLQPVIRTLAFRNPDVHLQQDGAGVWNVAGLLKKRPPPPFSQIHLRQIQVKDGVLRLDRPNRQMTFQEVNVRLNLTIQAPGRPLVAVVLHEGSVGFTAPPYPAVQAQLAWSFSEQEVRLTKTEIYLAEQQIMRLQGSITDLAAAPTLALKLTTPELQGSQLRQIWPAWPAALNASAGLEANGPLADLQLVGNGALQDCRWRLNGQWRQLAAAPPEFDFQLHFNHLAPARVAALGHRDERLEGWSPLDGAVTLSGVNWPWSPDKFQVKVELAPFSHRQARFERATATLRAGREPQSELALALEGNFGRLETQVRGRFWPDATTRAPLTGNLALTTSQLNPALLLGPKAPKGSLHINFKGDFQIPPAFDWHQARVMGELRAAGVLQEHNFQEFLAQGRWEAGELHLNPARLMMGNLKAEASGVLSPANADLKLAAELSPSGPWPLRPDFKGQMRLEGTLKGPWKTLAYQARFQGRAISWRRLALESVQGQTAGTASRDAVTVSAFEIQARDLKTPIGLFGLIQGRGQTKDGSLTFGLKAEQAPGQGGNLAGVASWEANTATIRIADFHWGPPQFRIATAEPVTLTLGPSRFEITPLRLHYQNTVFTLAGRITQDNVGLQAKLENLQFADLARLEPRLSLLRGGLSAQVDIGGTGRAPVLKGQLTISPGYIGTFRFDSFQAAADYRENLWNLSGLMVAKPDRGRFAWQGKAPAMFSLLPWSWNLPETGLQLRAWTDNLTLGLFADLIPGVAASEGPMELNVQATGGLHKPLLSGELRYGPGTLTLRESGAPFAIEPGEIRLAGDRLILPRLVFHSGDGQGEITGGARLEGLKLADVNLNLVARQVLAIQREGSWAVANGQASLQGTWPNFRADGRLTVPSGQFRLNFFRSERNREIVLLPRVCQTPASREAATGAIAVERNFTVNLTIDIPGGVWLRDRDIKSELEGQLKVLRQPPGPKYLGGWVKAKNGVFAINNKMFTVEKAMLTFPGEPHKPIMVEARAARQIDDYTLYVFASGPLENPRTGLESNPPLPSRDQLSLLVFDHLADKMTREEYVTVTQKAMGLLGSVTAQKLKALFGEGLPLLGDVSPTTSQEALGVGKKLGKDLTVSYERKLNPLQGEDVNQVRLDYKIHKYFNAETQLGRKNTGGDLFFNIDF